MNEINDVQISRERLKSNYSVQFQKLLFLLQYCRQGYFARVIFALDFTFENSFAPF